MTSLAPHFSEAFVDFLRFEQRAFGDPPPIAAYDPYLIRYGEYSFILDAVAFHPGERVLDLGCEANIFMLYLASKGLRVTGIDVDPEVAALVHERKLLTEQRLDQRLDVVFECRDATRLELESGAFDVVVATSSIEHMFSPEGDGDSLAVESIARVLKPDGVATITVPMSNGGAFHEAPNGDGQFAGPYRLYTPETLQARIASHPALRCTSLAYLMQRTPDERFPETYFSRFWAHDLSLEERLRWAWANPILASVFNPRVTADEGERDLDAVNTALVCLRKVASD